MTEAEVKNLGGVAPAAPAPPPVAAAPAPKLPKTGSPLPLAAPGGALSLLAGLGARSFRRSR
ncbi:MAG TPA: LPXTG cell wall anchor domain-containing protein [Thermoanaerobaculia bacterium]|nr:LPXTG cell wall anchor domain-containing protein [Thermoanaerobaculia bacterium]